MSDFPNFVFMDTRLDIINRGEVTRVSFHPTKAEAQARPNHDDDCFKAVSVGHWLEILAREAGEQGGKTSLRERRYLARGLQIIVAALSPENSPPPTHLCVRLDDYLKIRGAYTSMEAAQDDTIWGDGWAHVALPIGEWMREIASVAKIQKSTGARRGLLKRAVRQLVIANNWRNEK